MFKVYLAGYIHDKVMDQCVGWRNKIKEIFNHDPRLGFLDPLDGQEIHQITKSGLICPIAGSFLVARDRFSVDRADIVVANLCRFGESRVPIGTLFEICWAAERKIPIIVITDEDQFHLHPFMITYASVIVENIDEAVVYLKFFASLL
jgi:nucleoside 2-deoxyribosyltransferase